MKAILNRIRISPRKANLVAGMVRGKKVSEALSILKFIPKKGGDIIYKVVHSAAYNAKNNFKQNLDDLVITRILVTKGPTYKRHLPISRGRVHPIRKRTSHITVEVGVLGAKVPEKTELKAKVEAKVEGKGEDKAKVEKKTVKKTTAKKTETKKTEAKKEKK